MLSLVLASYLKKTGSKRKEKKKNLGFKFSFFKEKKKWKSGHARTEISLAWQYLNWMSVSLAQNF